MLHVHAYGQGMTRNLFEILQQEHCPNIQQAWHSIQVVNKLLFDITKSVFFIKKIKEETMESIVRNDNDGT
jgi:hypothetical protein